MNFSSRIQIANKYISSKDPVFLIAEAGVNHNGDLNLAKKMIDVGAEAGVDAIKFQSFKTESLILKSVEKAEYQKALTGKDESQFEMLKRLELSLSDCAMLKKYTEEKGLLFLTTPFDEDSLEEIAQLDLCGFKVSSTDLTNLPFLKKIAQKGKPIILSSGMSYLEEVDAALNEVHLYNKDVVLLHCTGNYPAPVDEINLNVLNTFADTYSIIYGYSDHSEGVGVSPYSVPMGARVIEKHYTLDKNMPGPDHKASLDPGELKSWVDQIRLVERYMGSDVKEPTLSELENRSRMQKCLTAKSKIREGEIFTDDNVVAKRTGGVGITPLKYKDVIGQVASQNYDPDDIIIG